MAVSEATERVHVCPLKSMSGSNGGQKRDRAGMNGVVKHHGKEQDAIHKSSVEKG